MSTIDPLKLEPMSDARLTEEDVRRGLDPARLVAELESAFRDRYPSVIIPERTHAEVAGGIFLTMSCYDAGTHALGLKLIMVRDKAGEQTSPSSAQADNPDQQSGRVQATYLLLNPETAEPRLTISANYLTDLRTAATSAVATKFLARPDARTLGIFGTGRLARTHLAVLSQVRSFERVLICGRNPRRSMEFVQQVFAENPRLMIAPADAHTCASSSDVICTCTSSPTPLFDGSDLRPGTHLNLVGSFQPHTREVDTHTILTARVIADTYQTARSEAGELLIPLKEGVIGSDHVVADLHELVSGKKQGRRSHEEITVFKSAGCALEDLVSAELLLQSRRTRV